MPPARSHTSAERLLIGVRPEKMHIAVADDQPDERAQVPATASNVLNGTITDSSFTGVSTQFLVRTAHDDELTVFASNLRTDDRLRPGASVRLHWAPEHTFGLDAGSDPTAGVERVKGGVTGAEPARAQT